MELWHAMTIFFKSLWSALGRLFDSTSRLSNVAGVSWQKGLLRTVATLGQAIPKSLRVSLFEVIPGRSWFPSISNFIWSLHPSWRQLFSETVSQMPNFSRLGLVCFLCKIGCFYVCLFVLFGLVWFCLVLFCCLFVWFGLVFPECVAKGSRFKSEGLEVDTLFATFSFRGRFVVEMSSFLCPNRAPYWGVSTPCNTADIVGVWSSGGVCRWSSFSRRSGVWRVECGEWRVECGVWSLGWFCVGWWVGALCCVVWCCEVWSVKCGVLCGVWSVECCVECGLWRVESGEECGGWSVESGVWRVECGAWSVESGVWSV